jgi:putative FmdB family regulatory protein
MPTYEYRCRDCGEDLEVVQAFTDDPLTECPTCGGSLRKIFGNVGITFKGSGFYKTDSRKSSSSKAKSDSSSEKSDKSSDSSSSDSSSSDSSSASPSTPTGGDSKPSAAKDSSSTSKPKDKAATN